MGRKSPKRDPRGSGVIRFDVFVDHSGDFTDDLLCGLRIAALGHYRENVIFGAEDDSDVVIRVICGVKAYFVGNCHAGRNTARNAPVIFGITKIVDQRLIEVFIPV